MDYSEAGPPKRSRPDSESMEPVIEEGDPNYGKGKRPRCFAVENSNNGKNRDNGNSSNVNDMDGNILNKDKTMPPIILQIFPGYPTFVNELVTRTACPPSFKLTNDTRVVIKTFCESDHKLIRSALKDVNAKFFTDKIKQEGSLKVVFRKVPCQLSEEEIVSELHKFYCTPSKIVRIMKRENIPTPLVLVIMENTPRKSHIFVYGAIKFWQKIQG